MKLSWKKNTINTIDHNLINVIFKKDTNRDIIKKKRIILADLIILITN